MSASNSRPASVAGYYTDGTRHRSPSNASVAPQHQPHDFVRPKSSASSHRPSSRATNRPPSSAGRPASRISNAPISKPFHRLPQRQISRLISSSQSLVSQVTGLKPDDNEAAFRAMVDMVTRGLDYNVKAAPSSSMGDIAKLVHGRVERARINSQDPWADALQLSFFLLKSQIEKIHDIDSEITPARLPGHLSFLMHLSVPPTQLTVEHAENYLVNSTTPHVESETFDWANILNEEPFEGQHWEGVYGLPPGSTVEGWETLSLDIVSPSLSSMDSLPASDTTPSMDLNADSFHEPPSSTFGHRQLIEDLQRRQYWRAEWQTDASLTRPFTVKDASSLGTLSSHHGPSADRILGDQYQLRVDGPYRIKYIHEHDAVREVLMAFQGYKNSFLIWARSEDGTFSFEPSSDAPRIIHLTRAAQLSVVRSFAQTASTVEHLRRFVTCVSGGTASRATGHFRQMTRTMEAFSEAVETQIGKFNSWCATRERDIILSLAGSMPPLYVSLLNLEKTMRDSFSHTFDALLEVLRKVMGRATRSQNKILEVWMLLDLPVRFSPFTSFYPPSGHTAHRCEQQLLEWRNGDVESLNAGFYCIDGAHMVNGRPVVETWDAYTGPSIKARSRYPSLLWTMSFSFRLLACRYSIRIFGLRASQYARWIQRHTRLSPHLYFLDLVGNHVLRAGKAVGLLRLLDLPLSDDAEAKPTWMTDWPTFTTLLQEYNTGALVKTSREHLSRYVHDSILPHCQTPQKRLAQMVASECDLWLHLAAIEELVLHEEGRCHVTLLRDHLRQKVHKQSNGTNLDPFLVLWITRPGFKTNDTSCQRRARAFCIDDYLDSTYLWNWQGPSTRRSVSTSHIRRAQQERTVSTSLRENVVQTSDSESDLEDEDDELRFGPQSYRMPSASRDVRQLSGRITEMQDELDGLVRFVRREVEGLAGGTLAAGSHLQRSRICFGGLG
ncbi:hypothetical protein H4582DRAFT_2124148 [Lactarius indigo]|nr:hypothetical protein H4582DRAFT_2124148 [Lactarius indigo]